MELPQRHPGISPKDSTRSHRTADIQQTFSNILMISVPDLSFAAVQILYVKEDKNGNQETTTIEPQEEVQRRNGDSISE